MHSAYQTFETDRLWLIPTSENDATFVHELMNTPKWIQHIGDRKITSVDVAKHYIKTRMLPQLKKLGYGNYTLIRKSDGQKIGTCGLYARAEVDDIDIGFAFLPEYEKQGYAFESARTLIHAAFQEFGLSKINAYTLPENSESRKLLEKLGLTLLGSTYLPKDAEKLLLYHLSKESWLQRTDR